MRKLSLKRVGLAAGLFLFWILVTWFSTEDEMTDFKTQNVRLRRNTSTPRHEHHKTLEDAARNDNEQRLERVREICKKYNIGNYKKSAFKYPPAPQYSVFYYDLYDNLSFCPIYKAGSSTWLYNLCLLGGKTDEYLQSAKEQLSTIARKLYPELDYDQATVILPYTKKLMVVRHPFERLLSAYRDKLENVNTGWEHGTGHFYRKYGAKIVKKYRPGGDRAGHNLKNGTYYWDSRKPQPSGIEPTFKEFVRYLIDTDLLNYADDHWIPYNLFCTPCLLEYDYLSKVETLGRDQMFIIKDMRLGNKIRPHWKHKVSPNNISEDRILEIYFSQLTKKEIHLLFKKYILDFEMFDYSPEKYYSYAKD